MVIMPEAVGALTGRAATNLLSVGVARHFLIGKVERSTMGPSGFAHQLELFAPVFDGGVTKQPTPAALHPSSRRSRRRKLALVAKRRPALPVSGRF